MYNINPIKPPTSSCSCSLFLIICGLPALFLECLVATYIGAHYLDDTSNTYLIVMIVFRTMLVICGIIGGFNVRNGIRASIKETLLYMILFIWAVTTFAWYKLVVYMLQVVENSDVPPLVKIAIITAMAQLNIIYGLIFLMFMVSLCICICLAPVISTEYALPDSRYNYVPLFQYVPQQAAYGQVLSIKNKEGNY